MGGMRAGTGVLGLDEVLRGGLPRNRLYLLQGQPGSGKTTLALQILMAGARAGERGLYITLTESLDEIREVASSHGWDLSNIDVMEISAAEQLIGGESRNTVFHSSCVELVEAAGLLADKVRALRPDRLVVDSMAEVHLLAGEPWAYRLQVLRLKQLLAEMKVTALLVDDITSDDRGELRGIAHGILSIGFHAPEYGQYQRSLRVHKMRGVAFAEGDHDIAIRTGGIEVYPRMVAAELGQPQNENYLLASGIPELDAILGGGLDRGTTTLFLGPAGAGKSTMAMQFALNAAERGVPAKVFLFEERVETVCRRWDTLGRDIRPLLASGILRLRQVDPAELSPGEFTYRIRRVVEQGGVQLLVIDSLAGYQNAMSCDRTLLLQLHELQTYLGNQGVTTILVNAQHGVGQTLAAGSSQADVSYLADTIVLLRYYEYAGSIRKALSVAKRRSGAHENTIRDFQLGPHGITVGRPLSEFHGVLTGNPTYVSAEHPSRKPDP